jgi:polysaccharide export outer membrane protein
MKGKKKGRTVVKRIQVIAGIAVFFFCLGFSQNRVSEEYRIGPKDLLDINVFGLDEMNKTVRVSETGKISLPLLGEVLVDGLTKAEVERKLIQLLEARYLKDPQVTIFIREYQSKQVSVLGAVKSPGTYELLGGETLYKIIAEAGGLTNEAGEEIIVIRSGINQSVRIPLEDLIMKGDTRLNIPIEAGDVINVPVDETVLIYIFGQVRNPGTIQVKKSRIPTLLMAIAQAGGFSDRAAKGSVVIRRKNASGQSIEIKVNVKDILKKCSAKIKSRHFAQIKSRQGG